MKKMSKRMWAFTLTLIMALTMMLTSVTAFADVTAEGADNLVEALTIGDKDAEYTTFTAGNPEVTRYFFNAKMDTTDLSSLTVTATLTGYGTVQIGDQEKEGDYVSLKNIDLTTGQVMTVTVDGETRDYRLTACAPGEMTVFVGIDTSLGTEWANENTGADDYTKVLKGSEALNVPVLDVKVPSGATAMQATEALAKEVDPVITFNGGSSSAGTYIASMERDNCSLEAFDATQFSGWMYWVDDDLANVGASAYVLNDGQTVQWKFIVDYRTIWG